jgi:multidrug resistance efflux pump
MNTHSTSVPSNSGHVVSALPLLDNDSGFPALALAGSVRLARGFAWSLSLGFLVLLMFLIFLPWQQFVSGYGRIVALDPLDRIINLEAPLSGRVQKAFVLEGQRVQAGDVLFELVDNDPDLVDNLRRQQNEANLRQLSLQARLDSLDAQVLQQESAYRLAMDAARQQIDAARAAATTSQRQYTRIKSLFEDRKGLASERDFELATLERDRTLADLARAEADLLRTEADGQAVVSATRASRSSAEAELAAAKQAILTLSVQINQIAQQRVTAPRSGSILRLHATEGSFLRAGSPLCTLVPDSNERLVELWLDGNDLPLLLPRQTKPAGDTPKNLSSIASTQLTSGSPVRLQFEGWPAVQLIGWPSLARGTFGGEIMSIDATDNGRGQFRVLVAPKPDPIVRKGQVVNTVAWPDERWLRQGVRVHGWVLLQRVPLWFEVWRQINGFPPNQSPEAFHSIPGLTSGSL